MSREKAFAAEVDEHMKCRRDLESKAKRKRISLSMVDEGRNRHAAVLLLRVRRTKLALCDTVKYHSLRVEGQRSFKRSVESAIAVRRLVKNNKANRRRRHPEVRYPV